MVSALSGHLESKMVQKVRQSQQVSSAQARVPCPLCYATRLTEREREDVQIQDWRARGAGQRGTRDNYSSLLPPRSTLSLLVTHPSVQFSSVAQSYLTLCDPMDCSTPDLPVHHQLLESTQTHVH